MSAIHIPSKNRSEIQRIIDSAKERGSVILFYDALRILRLAGASVAHTYIALNSQEIMLFSSQIEPPIVLKRVIYDSLPDSGLETYKGISDPVEAVNLALGGSEFVDGMSFLIQETAPEDLKLSVLSNDRELRLVDVRGGVCITIPHLNGVEELIAERERLRSFLFNATGSEDYDIKGMGMLFLIICSLVKLFPAINGVEIRSMFLYRSGLGYIITDAFIFLK